MDAAEDFRDVYSTSPNVAFDDSHPFDYYNGDISRFIRSDNQTAELVYAATEAIQQLDIELFQYEPYDTQIAVLPYNSENCQPIVLSPSYQPSRQSIDGWIHRIARFDFRALPLCSTHVAIRITGGEHGWEMQVSRVTLDVAGELQYDPNFTLRDRTHTSDNDDRHLGVEWWIWVCALLGTIVVCLLAAMIVRRLALCCGDDERSIYHFSNVRKLLKRKSRPRQVGSPEVRHRPSAPVPRDASFTFSPVRVNSPSKEKEQFHGSGFFQLKGFGLGNAETA